jgi:CHAT domain-containing protein/tetratricopeptide (TPR) repeat protein
MRLFNRFLTALVTAALLTAQFPLGGRALKAAQAPEVNQIPDLAQSPGVLGARDTTQIRGFLSARDPLPLTVLPETGDLAPLTRKDSKAGLPLPAELGKAAPLLPQAGLKQDGTATLLEVEGQLEDGDQVLQDGSLYDLHTFEGEAGQFVEIRLSSEAFDTYLILVDPDGEQVAANDDGGEGLNSIIQVELPATGRYAIVANAYNTGEQGRYRLTLTTISAEEYQQGQEGTNANAEAAQLLRQRLEQLVQQGIEQFNRGQFREAIASWEQVLEVVRAAGNRQGEGALLNMLGAAHRNLSQHERAIDLHEQALAIAREIGDLDGEVAALGNLGIVYRILSQYQRAIDFFEQSLAIAREIGDCDGEGRALGNLGLAHNNLGQYERAIYFYEQSLTIFRELGGRAEEGTVLGNLGLAYQSLGEYERVIYFYEQSLTIFRELGRRAEEGTVLGNLGAAYRSLGEYERAIDLHEQRLAIAREIGDRAGEAYALGNLGVAYRSLGQDDRALEQFGQAVAIFDELGVRAEEAFLLSNIGKLLNLQTQPELAILFLKASVDIREAIRGDIRGLDTDLQQSFTDTVAADYRLLADLLLQQDRILEAQRVLDLLKVQELDDYLQDVRRNGRTEGGVDYLRPELTILARYSDLQDSAIEAGRELASLKAIPIDDRTAAQTQRIATLDALLREINSDFRDFARSPEIRDLIEQLSFEARDASLDLAELNRLRDELQQLNAVIFYPLVLEDRLELIITTPDAPPLRRTVPISREELNRTILAFRDALETQDPDVTTPAQQLYDWLIAPLQADLEAAGVDTIIYAPDGQLRYIPLAALHDGDQWLAQRYQVNNITAESLTDFNEADAAQPTILAAAYTDDAPVHTPLVNGTPYTFTGLPGARDEVALLPSSRLLLDGDFSLAALLPIMTDYSVLHLATHAAFVPGVPEDSFILFGNGDTPTLRDIESWTLNGMDLY